MEERRKEQRLRYQAPVLIQPQRGKRWYNGSIFNFSRRGMYIETEFNGRSGQKLSILVQKPPYGSGPYLHRARIRWAKELPDAVVLYRYGCGVDYYMTVDYSLDSSSLPIQPRSGEDRRSGRDRRKAEESRRRDVFTDGREYTEERG
ncbi:MAG: hypothetical protein AMJ54_01705 [Deltaproteobacteria bacterium SG8_13]|nr:MAG: hypothetical protein AMJ54_01705 [Deltaproteobacteria bacterium SG8_13]